ncbi:MAG: histidine--tRNA ligase [Candidatus Omnitrophica bacterium]|nr:histidine--tRNA ligase [Candidatus Omnitrophota bacterium]
MSDIFLPEVTNWQFVEDEARLFFKARLYEEIRTPVVEYTELFQRSIGEVTDIVSKEMYTFCDRGERSLTLRPEMTVSIVRAVIENNLLGIREPLKLFYSGPMFRAERPQAGRKRQFYQIGVEVIGNDSPFCDAEVIRDLVFFLERLGLERDACTVKLNNIGCPQCRPAFLKKLREFFTTQKESLCESCQVKFEKNVLRIFDCKNKECKEIAAGAPKVSDNVCEGCREHFTAVEKGLMLFQIPYTIDKNIVRGLDYYTSTVFEVTSKKLGAQDAIAAGGRYNNLLRELGGEDKSAIGFALGVERLLVCLEDSLKKNPSSVLERTVYVAYGDNAYIDQAKQILARLEALGYATYADLDKRSLKSQLKRANKFGLRWVLILNQDEVERGTYQLKDLRSLDVDQCLIFDKSFEANIRASMSTEE